MKELSIEEKAKAYDKAIEELKGLLEGVHEEKCDIMEEDIIKIFPELAESKDEKIRKYLLKCVKDIWADTIEHYADVTKEQVLAWLEKQGEHANFRNKIQVGDKVTRNQDGVLVNLSQLKRVAKKQGNNMGISEATKQKLEDNLNKALEKETPESCNEFLDKQGEQNPAWSEEDEVKDNWEYIQDFIKKLGHFPKDSDELDVLINYVLSKKQKFAWSEKDETKLKSACALIRNTSLNGNEDIIDSTITFIKSLKDRVQPKQEWSEEDENAIQVLRDIVRHSNEKNENIYTMSLKEKLYDWLKSLKDRCTWKPSDEQIKALEDSIEFLGCTKKVREDLKSLYEQLKKIKG